MSEMEDISGFQTGTIVYTVGALVSVHSENWASENTSSCY
jgi:hypothetical protein